MSQAQAQPNVIYHLDDKRLRASEDKTLLEKDGKVVIFSKNLLSILKLATTPIKFLVNITGFDQLLKIAENKPELVKKIEGIHVHSCESKIFLFILKESECKLDTKN